MSYPPTGDPWYDTLLNVTTTPLTKELTLSLDQIAGSGDAQIELTAFGYNSVLHHLVTEFNGQLIDDGQFNGRVPYSVQQAIDLSLLQEGENTLRLTLPADTGASADYVAFEGLSVTYPRALVAVDDQLRFTSAGTHFRVDGLTSADITVLRLDADGPVHLNNLVVTPEGSTYSVAFAGAGAEATYLVTGAAGCRAPRAMHAVSAVADPVSGQADYVVISHPNFIDSLAPFVAAREAQGYAMRVVNVDDIYATHGNGVFGAEAIQAFVGRAIVEMGADYFLLVGADTYDYRNYLNKNYVSYIPTLYRNTTGVITFAPADPVYTDVNGDDQPDAALGRWPVRTQAEVANLIAKTLAFDNKSYEQQAVLVHEDGFGVTQEAITAPLATAGWNFVMNAGPETGDPAVTKAGLVDALNAGVALTHFYGHGTNTRWTSSADLLSSTDVAALANQGKPTTLFVFDSYRTNYNTTSWYSSMQAKALLSGENGAAAVVGTTTLLYARTAINLGTRLTAELAQPGVTFGGGLQNAKAALVANPPYNTGSSNPAHEYTGLTLLGDPTLILTNGVGPVPTPINMPEPTPT
ncbi:MAG: hypothetical protein KDD78_20840, partial [Caldilineaceae bacterium]|nr:hypothetical protein [Caldilineaceae bacterium]